MAKKKKNIFFIVIFIIYQTFRLSYGSTGKETPKITVVRAVKIEPLTGDTREGQN